MRTDEELLEAVEYLWGGSYDEGENYEAKIITVKKEHDCVGCKATIKAKTRAAREKIIFPDEGRRTCYTCVDCLELALKQLEGN